MDKLKSPEEPFVISKWEVWEAFKEVKRNQGAPGVDGQPIADSEANLQDNLYKVWNRMSSGTYFPPRCVVVKHLGTGVETVFHADSYGYRPKRSAPDAVGRCRQRCWKKDWVIDLDIAKFFDSVRWDLIVKAVEAHTDAVWVVSHVKRWLQLRLKGGSYDKVRAGDS